MGERDQSPDSGVLAVLWPEPASPKPGPKPRFTVAGIADAAIEVADAHGLEAVTMQQVAADLGTTKMALYRYLPGRAELLAVMLDRVLGQPDRAEHNDWREGLAAWAHGIHRQCAQHPWVVELAQEPHLPGPHELSWYESGLAATAELPLAGGEKLDLLALVVGHVLSLVRQHAAGVSPEDVLAAGVTAILSRHGTEHPHTLAAFTDGSHARNTALEFGLERILDGVEQLIAGRT